LFHIVILTQRVSDSKPKIVGILWEKLGVCGKLYSWGHYHDEPYI